MPQLDHALAEPIRQGVCPCARTLVEHFDAVTPAPGELLFPKGDYRLCSPLSKVSVARLERPIAKRALTSPEFARSQVCSKPQIRHLKGSGGRLRKSDFGSLAQSGVKHAEFVAELLHDETSIRLAPPKRLEG